MKQLLIKLGLWEEKGQELTLGNLNKLYNNARNYASDPADVMITKELYQKVIKHYCEACERWFADTRGKLMHDRHRHKDA